MELIRRKYSHKDWTKEMGQINSTPRITMASSAKASIDFHKVRQAMDDIGYRGWIQWEGVQLPLGLEQSCRQDVKHLRSIFPAEV